MTQSLNRQAIDNSDSLDPNAVDAGSLANVSAGQVVKRAKLNVLLAAMRVMVRSTGLLKVETQHHAWRMLLQGGGVVLMEEEGQAISSFTHKFANHGIKFAKLPEWDQRPANRPYSYPFVNQVFKRYPEPTKQVLKEVLSENLLAMHLEDQFTFVWTPTPEFITELPIWQLALLEGNASREAKQWQQFECVQHPYQKVQLLDAANMLARVGNDNFPLFARVTTGQHRLSEIADNFKQSSYRTALLLDKLAQKKIVSILPLVNREAEIEADPPTGRPGSAPAETPRIFVVDDSPVLLRQFRDLLTNWGYNVSLTDDALQATQLILDFSPVLVFMDINMPGLNGFELIKQIRKHPTLTNLPIVLVTAENSMTNSFRAKWASCRFIAKPRSTDDTDNFREELRKILRELAPLPTDVLV
ncbi:MAG: response regulator [Pseudanabaenaceae cyanobacterium bins.68]|nr:response regulator [Pseudanabaenaceae cyanobacterium bins.68]